MDDKRWETYRSNTGFVFILSVLDCFSEYVLLSPMRTANTRNIKKNSEDNIFLAYRALKRIITDDGIQFESKHFKDINIEI